MVNRIIIIPKDDLVKYPPTISLINVLLNMGKEIVCVGRYTDEKGRMQLVNRGVKFVNIYREIKDESRYRIVNWLTIIKRMLRYKKEMRSFFDTADISEDDLVWFIYSNAIAYLQPFMEKMQDHSIKIICTNLWKIHLV